MTAFNQNKVLEERAFYGLNWGYYMKGNSAKEGRLLPFIFLYKLDKRIKIINFQEGEDNFEIAMNILSKSNEDFDQYIVGYQGQMILSETKVPSDVIIVKAFDRRQELGAFIAQKYRLTKDSIIGIVREDGPIYIKNLPMSLPRITIEDLIELPELGTNFIKAKNKENPNKIDLSILIRHNSENEIYFYLKDCLGGWIERFLEEDYSGLFFVNIAHNESLNTRFLSFILKDAFQTIYTSKFVQDNFTSKQIGLTFKVDYGFNHEVLVNETTQDAINEINDLKNILSNVNTKEK
ncbi:MULTISPECIES: hypothetical protein [unclassified Cellulophaga]|uniref:hypothetical protein n=1 Tax=unclassified Cellulophaga TaxID=2634405 RepID=UPI0026E40C64|nr:MULTISPECIES: hypothetical protein [unclassified Cellulophaga]MDO6489868.1 hypothetical protein [Cellulophaga sp. 2_MG-2023]MDO6494938.1 hypothetical protein [Cellulophaga sp. 3_MG-2023]